MVRDTSSGGGLPTCQTWKVCLERQKSYSPDTICYGCTDQFDLEVKVQGQRSPTMVRDTSSGGGLPTCQICKAFLERQKVTARTRFVMDGGTDRLITIGHPPQSGRALIKTNLRGIRIRFLGGFVCLFVYRVLNATFSNISVISWRSVLLVKETEVHGENHRPVASHCQTLAHKVVSSTHCLSGIWTHNVNGDQHWLHR
jgi:hypothetical protein